MKEDADPPSSIWDEEGSNIPSSLTVTTTDLGTRLDLWLHQRLTDISRGNISKWIQEGHILVDGKTVKPNHKPKTGQQISISPPVVQPLSLVPQKMSLKLLYEDSDLLVIDKPPGLVVHPGAGHEEGTLVHGLLHHCKGELSGIGGVARPGIVHRLDQDTSGCLIIAKNDVAHQQLTQQFAARSIGKSYLAVVCGCVMPEHGTIHAPIARHPNQRKQMAIVERGRPSVTDYKVIQSFGAKASWVMVALHTGRTHQIRVHFKHLGYPLFGDEVYGKKSSHKLAKSLSYTPSRQMLHAWNITFEHPRTHQRINLVAPVPEDFQEVLNRLAASSNVDLKELPSP